MALIVGCTCLAFACGSARPETSEQGKTGVSGETSEAEAPPRAKEEGRQIVVYYFHGARRCRTCRAIEAFAREVVESGFTGDLRSGTLAWKAVNVDEPGNEHFIKEFGLVSSSLVIVETRAGETVRFEILQKVWSLVRDRPRFDDYVRQAIVEYLG